MGIGFQEPARGNRVRPIGIWAGPPSLVSRRWRVPRSRGEAGARRPVNKKPWAAIRRKACRGCSTNSVLGMRKRRHSDGGSDPVSFGKVRFAYQDSVGNGAWSAACHTYAECTSSPWPDPLGLESPSRTLAATGPAAYRKRGNSGRHAAGPGRAAPPRWHHTSRLAGRKQPARPLRAVT